MKFLETNIKGLYVINYKKHDDLRGELWKPYNMEEYEKKQTNSSTFKEVWFTRSKLNVIRGMHYQTGDKASEKVVSCVKGRVLDVVLDVRKDSKTYGQYFSMELSGDDPRALYIPKDCAHGYRVLEDDSIMLYMATEVHFSSHDIGIKWDSFGFPWEINKPILSKRDKNLPEFKS